MSEAPWSRPPARPSTPRNSSRRGAAREGRRSARSRAAKANSARIDRAQAIPSEEGPRSPLASNATFHIMRVIARNVLVAFWDKHPETKTSLERWHRLTKAAQWTSTDGVQSAVPKAKVLNRERVSSESQEKLSANCRVRLPYGKSCSCNSSALMRNTTASTYSRYPAVLMRPTWTFAPSATKITRPLAEIEACWCARRHRGQR